MDPEQSSPTTGEPRVDRRRALQAGVVGAGLVWVAPTILASSAYAQTCSCAGVDASVTFWSDSGNLPNHASCPNSPKQATASVCRTSATQSMWLSAANNTTSAPEYDDIAGVTVTSPTNVTRTGVIYRWQTTCRSNITGTTANNLLETTKTSGGVDNGRIFGNTASALTSTVFNYLPGTAYNPSSWPSGGSATGWLGAIDIKALFGAECGTFTVTVQVRNGNMPAGWTPAYIVRGT